MSDLKTMLGKLYGFWKLETSENFDEYMKAVDVGFMMRKLGSAAKPNVRIDVDGDSVVLKSETTFKTHEIKFKLDEEFEEVTADGRKAKSTFKLDSQKLIQTQGGPDIIPSTIIRELKDDDTLVCICEAKGITSTRVYHRIPE